MSSKIRKGDNVVVLSGRHKGRRGAVLKVLDGGQEKYQQGEAVKPLLISTPASETTQETGGTIDMKAEQAVTNASMAPN